MTDGGSPLNATLSVALLMYKNGFRWWNMGYAAAVAFVLFLVILALTVDPAPAPGTAGRMKKRPAPRRPRRHRASSPLTPLVWMVSASLMPTGEASEFPPPLLSRRGRRSCTTGSSSRASRSAAPPSTASSSPSSAPRASRCLQLDGRLRLREAPLSGPRPPLRALLAALVIPAQVAMLPLFLMLRSLGLVNTYVGAAAPTPRRHLRHLPRPPVRPRDPGRPPGRRAPRGRVGVPHLLDASSCRCCARCSRRSAIFTFLATWNDFVWPLVVLTDESRYTLPVALANLVGEHVRDIELMMAGSVLTVLPVLLLFLLLQTAVHRGHHARRGEGVRHASEPAVRRPWARLLLAAPEPASRGARLLRRHRGMDRRALRGVSLTLSPDAGENGGGALRIDYDFRGHGGWAAARKEFPRELPENWAIRLRLRGEGPPQTLEFKLLDPSGKNVWWSVRRDYAVPARLDDADDPQAPGDVRLGTARAAGRSRRSARSRSRSPRRRRPRPRLDRRAVSRHRFLLPAPRRRRSPEWRSPPGAARRRVCRLDLGSRREIGGLSFFWDAADYARRYDVEVSDDGTRWRLARSITSGRRGAAPGSTFPTRTRRSSG